MKSKWAEKKTRKPSSRDVEDEEVLEGTLEDARRGPGKLPIARPKIPGTTIDAYCASIQARCETEGGAPSWCMFSSWLAVLVSGKSKNKGLGTVEDHIAVAVRGTFLRSSYDANEKSLNARRHTGIDFGAHPVDYAAFRRKGASLGASMGRLRRLRGRNIRQHSRTWFSSWAEPLLLKVVDTIREFVGVPRIEWDLGQWKRVLDAPEELERQLDGWSCGLFLAMAAKCIANQKNWAGVKDSHKDEIQKEMFEMLVKQETRIKCRACNKWIKLQADRKYDPRNWLEHRGSCSKITGTIKERRLETKKPKTRPPGVFAISSYFSRRIESAPSTSASPASASPVNASVPSNPPPTDWRPKYGTVTYKAVDSLDRWDILAPSPGGSSRP
ncbi:hypothetical protein B0H13DRAFT_1895260 [Mycena leptocephala]|nr:hypothetical protein B0H13DRAFT_1895260 [Mycena leptocephala]